MGWPASVHAYPWNLSGIGKCLLWGMCTIVPSSLQSHILQDLHLEYGGMTCIKSVACSCVWWPKLDLEIEALTKSFTAYQSAIGPQPLHHFTLGVGLPNHGSVFMWTLLDRSRVLSMYACHRCSSQMAMQKYKKFLLPLRTEKTAWVCFGSYLHDSVSQNNLHAPDNGSQFVSVEYGELVSETGCCKAHLRLITLHAFNVQTFKQASEGSSLTLQHQLDNFLLSYIFIVQLLLQPPGNTYMNMYGVIKLEFCYWWHLIHMYMQNMAMHVWND